MLTRLEIDGFKNLTDVDVRFGPFTCIAGPNGVGKSNLFDAIDFLSSLAEHSLAEAAAEVRGVGGRLGDIDAIFTGGRATKRIRMSAEMIIPEEGLDDLGSPAKASITFLRYEIELRPRVGRSPLGPLEISSENLDYLKLGSATSRLRFPHSTAWRESVLHGRRTVPYIQSDTTNGQIQIRADSGSGKGGGGKRTLIAANLPRTVLSSANSAAEHRTQVLARKEMLGWTRFQLEPTALRAPDPFHAPRRLSPSGHHLPATLYGLARDQNADPADVYQGIANRLAELMEDVHSIRIDEDPTREMFILELTDLLGRKHSAGSLSDGTLRFLALAILEAGSHGPNVLCLEEPENGIHPDRIPVMLELLQDLAMDVEEPVGPHNPMRQVIVNTHSPAVIQALPDDVLVFATATEVRQATNRTRPLELHGVPGTWRAEDERTSLVPAIPYLRPMGGRGGVGRRLIDREDVRQLQLFASDAPVS